jgi:hypothetical protein
VEEAGGRCAGRCGVVGRVVAEGEDKTGVFEGGRKDVTREK